MWVFSAGERGGLAVLALFRALGMLLCAALAPGAILSAGGWSEAMARGDNRVCFARVGTGRLAAVGRFVTTSNLRSCQKACLFGQK
jgi:hypothetical protein|eukprot:COSAG03_NODE_5709_length_1191_cov_21.494505_2_plen_86_part_00